MFRQMTTRMGILALAGLGLCYVVGPADAQQGWPINGNWGSSEGSVRSYSPSYYSPSPTYSFVPTPTNSYTAFYPTDDNTARMRLVVPAGAKVWFGNYATKQGGQIRNFVSPALEPGQQYVYEIKAQWRDKDGREVTKTRRLDVSANADVSLDLTRQ